MAIYFIPKKSPANLFAAMNCRLKDVDGGAEIGSAPLETIALAVARLSAKSSGEGADRPRPKLDAADAISLLSLFLAVLASEPWGRAKRAVLKDVAELIYYSDELSSEQKLDLYFFPFFQSVKLIFYSKI